jgi:uncharacterized protein YraI
MVSRLPLDQAADATAGAALGMRAGQGGLYAGVAPLVRAVMLSLPCRYFVF